MRQLKTYAFLTAIVILVSVATAGATPVLCQTASVNHMNIDNSTVSACFASGVGNLIGSNSDLFTNGVGSAFSFISKDGDNNSDGAGDNGTWIQLTQIKTLSTGTFSFHPSLWGSYSDIAIGFKFGTGNQPDEWFVYKLNPHLSSGSWEFVNIGHKGGGLSHVNIYGIPDTTLPPQEQVPEPTSLILVGMGLASAGLLRKRSRN